MYTISKTTVKAGDIFAAQDGSMLICGSCLEVQWPTAEIIYTDPPWNDGILRTFYKYAERSNAPTFEMLISKAVDKMKACNPRYIFIEMGTKNTEMVAELMHDRGLLFRAKNVLMYGRTKFSILCFGKEDIRLPDTISAEVTRNVIMKRLNPKSVLDPFAGVGKMLKAAPKTTAVFGIEIIPDKFQRMLGNLKYRNLVKQ